MSEGKLTWREALQAMMAGDEVERSFVNGWQRMRMSESLQFWDGDKWHNERATFDYLSTLEWRRVPKCPRVHELPAKWRGVKGSISETDWELRVETIHDLEAALRDDELVSLKGVTADEIVLAYRVSEEGHWAKFVLDYLRSKVVKP